MPSSENIEEAGNPRRAGANGGMNCAWSGDGAVAGIACKINSPRIPAIIAIDTKRNLM
jgi:hypothetical protein